LAYIAQIARPHDDFFGLTRPLSQSSKSLFVNKEIYEKFTAYGCWSMLLLVSGVALAQSGT